MRFNFAVFLVPVPILVFQDSDEIHVSRSLEMHVSVRSVPYTPSERIETEIKITNVGKEAVAFWNEFSWDSFGTLSFQVFDEQGTPLENWLLIDDFRRVNPETTNKWATLVPGQSLTGTRLFFVQSLVSKPGRYTLQVTYRAPTRTKDFEAPPRLTREFGPLSGTAQFEVKSIP